MTEKKKRSRIWIAVILVPLAILLLLYILDLGDLMAAFRRIRLDTLALGGAFMVIGLVLISVRWRYLLDNQVVFRKVFHSDTISYMIRMFTPVFVPVLRVATLSMTTEITAEGATPGIMAERLLETIMRLIALVLATVLVSTTNIAPGYVLIWVALLAALFAGIVHFSNNAEDYLPRLTTWLAHLPRLNEERLQGPMDNLGRGFSTVGTSRRLLISLLMSLLMWGCFLAGHALLLDSLDLGLNWTEAFAIAAAVLVVLPPSTPAMIGTYQAMMVAVLVPFGFTNTNNLLAYGILTYAVQMLFWVITGMWSLRQTPLKLKELTKLSSFRSDSDETKADESEIVSQENTHEVPSPGKETP